MCRDEHEDLIRSRREIPEEDLRDPDKPLEELGR
jgi:hypothetical protein